jgi:RNA polymerase sigma factor (sigma-70 family)
MDKKKYSDQEYIEGFLKNKLQTTENFYELNYPLVKNLVTNMHGVNADVDDVMQEGMLSLVQAISRKGFILTGSLSNYFFTICKNVWLNCLKRNKYYPGTYSKHNYNDQVSYIETSERTNEQRLLLFDECFKSLDYLCQQVIEMWLQKIPYNEIADQLKIVSTGAVRNRKYICDAKLSKLIKNHKDYKNLSNEK